MPVLTGIDIIGIQSYIFASNRLRDVLSASWMVEHVTSNGSLAQWGLTADRVLVAAGGNAILEFPSKPDAKNWTAHYTRWLHETAPGLDAVIAHQPYDRLAWGLKALQIGLACQKLERLPNAGQLGLSVTASCTVTGLPATHLEKGDLVSPRVKRLREHINDARRRWDAFRPHKLELGPGWSADFPDELDHMGRTHGGTSLLGVVHVDANSVGRAIGGWLRRCIEDELDDRVVRTQYCQWSSAITNLGKQILHVMADLTAECVHTETDEDGRKRCFLRGTPHELGFALYDSKDNRTFLPLQPVLLGGDDLTLVCDGRIALDLAATALHEFEKHKIPHLGEEGGDTILTACAGVALVKAHAPFYRSYELAEGLCQSAKRLRQKNNQNRGVETGCWLDWHVGTTRPGEPVEEIRERQYQYGALTMRPYPLVKSHSRDQTWNWLDEELLGPGRVANDSFRGFRHERDAHDQDRTVFNCWSGSRSRVKRLAFLVSNGGDGVKRQVEAWRVSDPAVQMPAGLPGDGFLGSETPLLDAIELMDLHLRLEPDPRRADSDATIAANGIIHPNAKETG